MPDDDPPFDLAGCLDLVRQRDQLAARELVDHLYPLVIRIVRSHLPRRVPEEDLAQEIFLKMFTRLEQYQGAVPFSHWVSRIAVTTCIDHLRAQKRRPEFRWADLSETEAEVLDNVMTNESDVAVNDALSAHELVHKLLDQLKPDAFNVLTIHAEVEGISCNTLFRDFLAEVLQRGWKVLPLGALLPTDLNTLPTGRVVPFTQPGREGWIAAQA